MGLLNYIFQKRHFDINSDRLGPDLPFTHWRLYLKPLAIQLCKKKFAEFADSAEFRPGAYEIACSKIKIGRRVVIRPGSMLFADPRENGAGIIIEDDVLVGSCVHFYVTNHRYMNPTIPIIDQGHLDSKQIVVEEGSWIGANVTILPGVIIGRNTVVGAGSIVTKSIPRNVVAAGNPARVIKAINLVQ